MNKAPNEALLEIAQGLFALEKAIDEALARCVELHRIMPKPEDEPELAMIGGKEPFEGAAAIFAALALARQQVVDTHRKIIEETKEAIARDSKRAGAAGQAKAPLPGKPEQ